MKRYQIIKPEMPETLRAIGKTNEEMAHEFAYNYMLYMNGVFAERQTPVTASEYFGFYERARQHYLKGLEARDEK